MSVLNWKNVILIFTTPTPNISLKICYHLTNASSRLDQGNRSNTQSWNKFNLKHLQQSTGFFSFYLCPPCSTPPTSTVLYHRKEHKRLKEGICVLSGMWIGQLSYCITTAEHSGSDQDRATAGYLCWLKDVAPIIAHLIHLIKTRLHFDTFDWYIMHGKHLHASFQHIHNIAVGHKTQTTSFILRALVFHKQQTN